MALFSAIALGITATIGTIGLIEGADAAGAAKKAGQAQVDAANQEVAYQKQALAQQQAQRQAEIQAAVSSAQMSPTEANSIQRILDDKQTALSTNLASINKQQDLLNAMDPQVKAAGSDLYSLLQGQSASVLKPYQDQQTVQRNQLISQLTASLGPGALTSSAGMEALSRFDANAALSTAQVQQAYIGQVSSTYQGLTGQENTAQNALTGQTENAFAQNSASNAQVLQANQNIQQRITNAQLGAVNATPINFSGPAQAQASVTAVAGNPFAGDQIAAANIQKTATGLGQIGGQLIGSNAFSGGGGSPTSDTTGLSSSQLSAMQTPFSYNSGSFGSLSGGNSFSDFTAQPFSYNSSAFGNIGTVTGASL